MACYAIPLPLSRHIKEKYETYFLPPIFPCTQETFPHVIIDKLTHTSEILKMGGKEYGTYWISVA
jgi:hypothetical protein